MNHNHYNFLGPNFFLGHSQINLFLACREGQFLYLDYVSLKLFNHCFLSFSRYACLSHSFELLYNILVVVVALFSDHNKMLLDNIYFFHFNGDDTSVMHVLGNSLVLGW